MPTERLEVVNVACPEAMATVLASVTAPSLKITVPVGVPAPGETALTVAVNVTIWPNTEGEDDVTVVALEAWPTTWGEAESVPLEIRKWVSPP